MWFIILVTVLTNGQVYSDVRPATDPKYNTEASCEEAGASFVQQEQTKIGSDNGKVFYVCEHFSEEEINKALGRVGS